MRSKLYVVVGVAAISAFALFASTQQWLVLSLVQGAAAVDSLSLSGQDLNPTLSPIAVAGLAAALALTIAGRVFRYVLGVLIAGLGLGILLISLAINSDPLNSAASMLSEITGITGDAQFKLIDQFATSIWPTVTLVTGALLAAFGLVVLAVSHKWKRGGRKYESGVNSGNRAHTEESDADALKRSASAEPDRISDWEMLSGGDDPSDTLGK